MKHGIFVTGTDTGVGKTLVSAALIHGFAARGMKSAGMKPVAAGCLRDEDRLCSEDAAMLQAASNIALPTDLLNPYAFEAPVSPHIAASLAGEMIDLDRIHAAFVQAQQQVDVLVVEGVGGFRVPLNATQDTADLAVMLALPVVLVVGIRLGCLNHALLSVEGIATRQLRLIGWVANLIDPEMGSVEENLATLNRLIAAPCLGIVAFQDAIDYKAASKSLEFESLLTR